MRALYNGGTSLLCGIFMNKRQEMYDKILGKIDENLVGINNRIKQVEAHTPDSCSHGPSHNFITELQSEKILWKSIKEEIAGLKKLHIK